MNRSSVVDAPLAPRHGWRNIAQSVRKKPLGRWFELVELEAQEAATVAGTSTVHNACDGGLGVEPARGSWQAKRDDEGLAGEHPFLRRGEHAGRRDVHAMARQKAEVAFPDDLALHAYRAAYHPTLTGTHERSHHWEHRQTSTRRAQNRNE
jgi:hypothetical protein